VRFETRSVAHISRASPRSRRIARGAVRGEVGAGHTVGIHSEPQKQLSGTSVGAYRQRLSNAAPRIVGSLALESECQVA